MSVLIGDDEHFDIEAEAIELLHREDAASDGTAHEFEATLSVLDIEACCAAHEQIEETTGGFASKGLVLADETAIHSAAADDEVGPGFGCGGSEFCVFFDGGGKICVREKDPITGGGENAIPDGSTLSGITRILQQF